MRRAAAWVRENRSLVLAVSVIAVPVIARYVPGFPAAEVLSALRLVLGM